MLWEKNETKQNRYDLQKVPLELPQSQQEWVISYCLANHWLWLPQFWIKQCHRKCLYKHHSIRRGCTWQEGLRVSDAKWQSNPVLNVWWHTSILLRNNGVIPFKVTQRYHAMLQFFSLYLVPKFVQKQGNIQFIFILSMEKLLYLMFYLKFFPSIGL